MSRQHARHLRLWVVHLGQPRILHPNFAAITGSGDLWTIAGDLIRLNQALRSGRLLPREYADRLWTQQVTLPTADTDPGPVVPTGHGSGTFLGRIRGHAARINPGDGPGYQSLLAYLPDQELDLVVLCNEEAPSLVVQGDGSGLTLVNLLSQIPGCHVVAVSQA